MNPTELVNRGSLQLWVLLLPAVLGLAFVRPAAAQPPDSEDAVQFTIQFEFARSSYWLGEPVLLEGRLTNWDFITAQLKAVLDLRSADTDLRLVRDLERLGIYRSYHKVEPLTRDEVNLSYGRAHLFQFLVLYHPDRENHLALDRPGKYQFELEQQVVYNNVYNHIGRHLPVTLFGFSPEIEVVEPPEPFRPAFELLRDSSRGFLDMNRLVASPASMPVFEQIVSQYPESRYAPWCLFALANSDMRLSRDDWTMVGVAEEKFRRLIEQYPDFVMGDDARMNLALLLRDNGKLEQALEVAGPVLEDPDRYYPFKRNEIVVNALNNMPNPYARRQALHWMLFPARRIADLIVQLDSQAE